jgi:hypothetical protein
VLPGREPVQGREAIVAQWLGAMGALKVEGFFASAGVITVTGDTAHGTWYQQEFLDRSGTRMAIIGEYTDDYVRRDGRWFFARRVYAVRTAH